MQCNVKNLQQMMMDIETGKIQLPEFQRNWVWDDEHIKAIIASTISGFPIGAAMFLECGNSNVRFKSREIEGAPKAKINPVELVLDGQQRLTSIYNAMYRREPVKTLDERKKRLYQYYYLDIKVLSSSDSDATEGILSIDQTRQITKNFGREVDFDLSAPELEYKHHMYPVNLIFDPIATQRWQQEYSTYHEFDPLIMERYYRFYNQIVARMLQYGFPVITLGRDTPREAVCQVFEQVNTGGVSLTTFELVTAAFAMDDFSLRKDWNKKKQKYFSNDVLKSVSETDFLVAVTLFSSYRHWQKDGKAVSCKKRDVLDLALDDYKAHGETVAGGFVTAAALLGEERIFSARDLPYSTQLIPLAVLCALLGRDSNTTETKKKLKRWYWCGVLGELYGGANETRYVNDVMGVMDWVKDGDEPRTVKEAYFNPTRLLSLQTRQSAAYKGIMALILKSGCRDFISGAEMDFAVYKNDPIDIHHIFPQDHCAAKNYPKGRWNSVVNKTPLTDSSNRELGGAAPSLYLRKLEDKKKVSPSDLNGYLASHLIDVASIRADDFHSFFIDRAAALLDLIGDAMGKTIQDRSSDDIVGSFGAALPPRRTP